LWGGINLGNVLSIICHLLVAIALSIDYLKDKKVYRLLMIMVLTIFTFSKTPFASGISKIAENTFVVIVLILILTIFYLLVKDYKEKKK
jgi:Ca2+/Na+ antiporter